MSKTTFFLALLVLLVAVPTPPASAATADRCQSSVNGASCTFECRAGDVIGVSAISATVIGACGGVTLSCSNGIDCLAGSAIALADGTGSCMKTAGPADGYVDCFALPLSTVASCTTSVAYAACAYACWTGDSLRVRAAGPGYPRVLSVCGSLSTGCQNAGGCEVTGSTTRNGIGICLSRTVDTTITCTDTSPAHTAPARCSVAFSTGLCFVACQSGGILGASSYSTGTGNARGLARCGTTVVSCSAAIDCLGVAPGAAPASVVGICLPGVAAAFADCFSLAPPAPDAPTCQSEADYGACTFSCSADGAIAASARPTAVSAVARPRVLATCGDAQLRCQQNQACAAVDSSSEDAIGICLSRTQQTAILCASV